MNNIRPRFEPRDENFEKMLKDAKDLEAKLVEKASPNYTQKEGATVGSAAGETSDWISSQPSRTEKIKQAAAMLGIKGDQAIKLYKTKLQNTTGMFTKKVEEIMTKNIVKTEDFSEIMHGEDFKEFTKRYFD